MKSVEIPTTDPQELLDQMSHLVGDEERRRFFDRRSDLVRTEQVEAICAEVARQVRIDAEKAIELAMTGRFLAELLDNDASRGLSARAAANAYHFSGNYALSQELYEAALEGFERLGDELSGAITRSSALYNMAYLGEFEQVYAWEAAARRIFERHDDRLRLAILDHNIGNVLQRQGRYHEAMPRYLDAYEGLKRLGHPENAAVCLNNVAACQLELHHVDDALEIYDQSRAYCVEQGLSQLVMEVDYHVAYLSFLRAEYMKAIRLFQTARKEAEAVGDTYQRALCDLDLSEAYLELNLINEAVDLARSAFDGFDRLKMPHEAAKALVNEALAANRSRRPDVALDKLQRARSIFQHEENRFWPGLVDLYRAEVLRRADRPEEALVPLGQALDAFEARGLASRASMCELLDARLQLQLGRPDAARQALERCRRRLDEHEIPSLEHELMEVLGEVEEARGEPTKALDAYQRCDTWLEQVHSRLRGEDLKIAFLHDKRSIYESLVWLTAREGSEAGRGKRVFDWIEKAKSRGLAELIALRADDISATTDHPEQVDRIRRLREELTWLDRQADLCWMRDDTDVHREVRALQDRARSKEAELLRAQRELEALESPDSARQTAPTVDSDVLRADLAEGTALVDYFVTRGTILASVVDRSGIRLVEVAQAARARELHRLLQFQLARSGDGPAVPARIADRATRDHLRTLYRELIEPLLPAIGDRNLVISPHDFLHYIPFHALMDADGAPLIASRSVTYAPSAGVHHLCATQELGTAEGGLVLGVADDRAPHILREVRTVADTLRQAGSETLLFEGDQATEDVLRRHGRGRRYVHLATHGIFRRDNPMFSAIQLGTSRLSLFDLYGLRLDADLVVLSGCGTGLASVQGADELVGLTRGLLYAGARSVLVTLWDVHDESTAQLMDRFYGHLAAGLAAADALRRALLEHREAHPRPYFWAPFVLVGA